MGLHTFLQSGSNIETFIHYILLVFLAFFDAVFPVDEHFFAPASFHEQTKPTFPFFFFFFFVFLIILVRWRWDCGFLIWGFGCGIR
ncbi:hypothetical protein Hanom_Chr16g01516851 [Helianthus anomalus]